MSHAREFLNAVCTDIVHLHRCGPHPLPRMPCEHTGRACSRHADSFSGLCSRKLTAYRGNYDVFEKTAAERLRNQRKAAESVAHKKQHMQAGAAPCCRPACVQLTRWACMLLRFVRRNPAMQL